MRKEDTLQKIRELGLLAVLRGPSADLTVQMVAALVALLVLTAVVVPCTASSSCCSYVLTAGSLPSSATTCATVAAWRLLALTAPLASR